MDPVFQSFGLALLLGLLVGLQREHAAAGIAGMRTFPLITLFGSVAAVLAKEFGGWIVAAGLLAIAALVFAHASTSFRKHQKPPQTETGTGTTTDVSMLLMYGVGAMLVTGPISVALAVGGAVAVLLQFKPELHSVATRLGDADLRAIMQFVLITCIILPVLPQYNLAIWPDPPYGHLNVLNPFEIWLMVVLIVGMSLGGYIMYKFFGERAGTLVGGILGGAISSTATTVSYARMVRKDSSYAGTASIVIMIASTVSCLRVLVAVAIVSRSFLVTLGPPVLVMLALTLVPGLILWLRSRAQPTIMPSQGNPSELTAAIVFGVMYAVVLFALAAAKSFLGSQGLYAVAGLSGLTEMDAITLSTARLTVVDPTVAADGWRMIVIAVMANMVSKAVLAAILGGWRLWLRVALLFSIPMAGGAILLAYGCRLAW